MRILFTCFVIFISLAAFAQKPNKSARDRFAGLDTAFARILKQHQAAGFAVAVVEKDKIVYAKGFGYKNMEARDPVTEHTQFAIGSVTKSFTAALIGLLEKDKLVELDKPVKTYLPALNFYNNEMNNHVTLRDMMSHRTGVSRYDYSWYFFPTSSRDSLMQRMQYMEPSEPLRRKWQYNNFMYLLQGVVVEKLTGKSWEENIKEKIFQPLGMANSNASLKEWIQAKDAAFGYRLKQDSIIYKTDYYDISGMAPAGSINSSVTDMAKYLSLWINGGKYQGKEILPSQYVTEAISSQMVVSAGIPSKERPDLHMSNYGLGWMLSSYRGHYRVEHGGNIDGFSSSASFFPTDSIGIVVLVNQDRSGVPNMVRNLISDRLLGLPYRDWQTQFYTTDTAAKAKQKAAMKTKTSNRKYGTKPTHDLKEFTGLYKAAGLESFEVTLKGDSLFMQVPQEKYFLRHYHYNVFDLWDKDDVKENDSTNIEGIKITFRMDQAGNITSASLPLENPDKPIVFTKSAKAMPMTKDSLQKYTGDYTLSGAEVKVYIKGENTLYVFVPGQPEYELIPTGKDKFTLKVLPTFHVQFSGNAKGEINELTFIQPNGNFKASRVVENKPK